MTGADGCPPLGGASEEEVRAFAYITALLLNKGNVPNKPKGEQCAAPVQLCNTVERDRQTDRERESVCVCVCARETATWPVQLRSSSVPAAVPCAQGRGATEQDIGGHTNKSHNFTRGVAGRVVVWPS